jgi:Zn-dependent protease
MEGVIRLGRFGHTEFTADWSFAVTFVLLAIYLATGVFPAWHADWTPITSWLTACGAAVLFAASVLIHELMHVVAGREDGTRIRGATLFPLGGVTHTGLEPMSPATELRMAIAGPAVSLLLAMSCFALASAGPQPMDFRDLSRVAEFSPTLGPGSTILLSLGWMNIVVCAINLLPGYPLDGGRALRAILWGATGDQRSATRIACRIGQGLGWASILCGVVLSLGISVPVLGDDFSGGPWLMLLGWFQHRAASASYCGMLVVDAYRDLLFLDALTDVAVTRVMRDVPVRMHPMVELRQLRGHVPPSAEQPLLPVELDGKFLGWVGINDLGSFDFGTLGTLRLSEVMLPVRYLPAVRPEQTIAEAVALMNRDCIDYVPVVHEQRLLGIVSRDDVVMWICREAAVTDRTGSSDAASRSRLS